MSITASFALRAQSRASHHGRRARFAGYLLPLLFLIGHLGPVPRAGSAQGAPPAATQQDCEAASRLLTPGGTFERRIAGGECHAYRMTLSAGDYAHVVVDQKVTDLSITVVGPDGQERGSFDGRWHGPEPVSVVAAAAGSYEIRVRSAVRGNLAERYSIALEVVRPARADDERQVAAERLSSDAKQLVTKGTVDALREAMKKYQEVLPLWQAQHDGFGEAQTLNTLSYVLGVTGQAQKALEYARLLSSTGRRSARSPARRRP